MTHSKRKYTRLSPSEWAELGAYWESGDHTLPELSDKYGVSQRAIQSHLGKLGSIKGSKAAEMAAAVKHEIFKDELVSSDILFNRAKETREATYANAEIIEALIMAQLQVSQNDPSQAFKAATALKALSLAASALERLHSTKTRALGLDRESALPDELPTLIFCDLSSDELASLREPDEDADDIDPFCPLAPAEVALSEAENDDSREIIEENGDLDEEARLASLKRFGGRLVRGHQP